MTRDPRQLTLDWPHEPSYAPEDFLPAAANREALQAIELWPDWAGRTLMVIGPEGSGKSHLAAIWARRAGATRIAAEAGEGAWLAVADAASALLIDDADRFGARESALFHLLNRARERGLWLLLTARARPDVWGVATPDLLSRLRLAPLVTLAAPDDDLVEAVLFKLFSDRQLQVEPQVVSYLALRIERSLGAARAAVADLDREALARGRRVTRVMAAEWLRQHSNLNDAP